MASPPVPNEIAYSRGVQFQMARYFTLPIPIFFNRFNHLFVSLFSILQDTLVENLIECWSVCVTLTFRNLGHMFMLLQVINEAVYEFVFAQDDLPFDIEHDRSFIDTPFNKLAVFLFCLCSLPAELSEDPIGSKAGVGLSPACSSAVAAPFPLLGGFYHPCPKWIQDDIPADFKEMAVFLNKDAFKPALEKVTVSFMPLVKELGINAVKLSHAEG
jgi:hypothetical protein